MRLGTKAINHLYAVFLTKSALWNFTIVAITSVCPNHRMTGDLRLFYEGFEGFANCAISVNR